MTISLLAAYAVVYLMSNLFGHGGQPTWSLLWGVAIAWFVSDLLRLVRKLRS